MPWPVPLVVGAIGYFGIRHGVPAWMASRGGPIGEAFARQADMLAPLAWTVLAMCSLAALASFVRTRHRRRLLDTRTGLDSIAALGWRDFERLVGEAFRRQGYAVEETGLGGADGGIDLVLSRGGRRTLVQCKRWQREKVPVNVVREMYGLLAHHRADDVRIATLGGFTRDAERFAAGKPIKLIDGATLLAMVEAVQVDEPATARATVPRIQSVQTQPATPASAPECPRCSAAMVERINRRDGSVFWGCTAFPACRGTR